MKLAKDLATTAMASNPHDGPPPPYSETDIYSASPPRGRSSHGDNISAADRSPESSTTGDVYTPPETPRSSHQQNFAGEAADHLATAAAAAYFDIRPAPRSLVSAEQLSHAIAVRPGSSPADFPLPEGWARRDVTLEDWQTFVNYLIPHHAAQSNESVIDRKLRAETDGDASAHAEAQLGQLHSQDDASQRGNQAATENTVREWNDEFFGPRGIVIRLVAPSSPRMPGSWDQTFDEGSHQQQQQQRGAGRGFSFAGVTVGEDGVAIGDHVVAGRNGLRVGGLMMDDNGITYNGRNIVPGPGPATYGAGGFGRPMALHRGRSRERGGRGRRGRHSRSSSVSSVSSSSSESSESSVGSLSGITDLKDSQLPITKAFLEKWLGSPDVLITKEAVTQAKAQIKEAKKNPAATSSPFDAGDLRSDVRGMLKEWKTLRKSQMQMRKQLWRERKAQRKQRNAQKKLEKKEKKAREKEMKRLQRDHERTSERERWRRDPRSHHHGHDHHRTGHGPHLWGGPPYGPHPLHHFPGVPVPVPGVPEMPGVPEVHRPGMVNVSGIHVGARVPGRARVSCHAKVPGVARATTASAAGPSGQPARSPGDMFGNFNGRPSFGVGGNNEGMFGQGASNHPFGQNDANPGAFGQNGPQPGLFVQHGPQNGVNLDPFGQGWGPNRGFSRGFGRGFGHGRGGGRGGPFGGFGGGAWAGWQRFAGMGPAAPPPPFAEGQTRNAPGSWPVDDEDGGEGEPHGRSAAMYAEADDAERALAEKRVELAEMKEALARMAQGSANRRGHDEDDEDDEDEGREEDDKVKMQRAETENLEHDIDQLAQTVELLRVDADAEFANELHMEEQRQA